MHRRNLANLKSAAMLCLLFLRFSCGINITRSLATTTCDMTKYKDWQSTIYQGKLISDPNFWRYQLFPTFKLTNSLAIELAVASCKNKFNLLQSFKAGRNGPIDIQSGYKVMCKDDCLESDALHQAAMSQSGCSCLELSTQPTDTSYHTEGDWCQENSARLLCSETGYCGVWNCRIDDFMCPRYEWNKKIIPFKGPGHCDRSSSMKLFDRSMHLSLLLVILLISAMLAC